VCLWGSPPGHPRTRRQLLAPPVSGAYHVTAGGPSACIFCHTMIRHRGNFRMCRFAIRPALVAIAGVIALGTLARSAYAQGRDYVASHYTKYEYRIPMRDGKKLFTAVYVPKDQSQPYPIMLLRTPYSVRPYGADQYKADLGPSPLFGQQGYIFVYQDVRGRWMSEGDFAHVRPYIAHKTGPQDVDETSDTWDTIDWLVKHVANHNGRVGMYGISYPGFYTSCGIIDAHPALVAASPQAPVADWFVGDDWHHNGAFFLAHAFGWMSSNDRFRATPTKKFTFSYDYGTPDGYQFFLNLGPLSEANKRHFKEEMPHWDEVMRHGNYDDFWKARNIRPHLKNIRPAIMTVGGLVRRRGFVWHHGNLSQCRGDEPWQHECVGNGSVAPWWLGSRWWRHIGRHQLQFQNG
jgi:uncharacterized protein